MQYINQNIYNYYTLLKLIKIFILITLCFKLFTISIYNKTLGLYEDLKNKIALFNEKSGLN